MPGLRASPKSYGPNPGLMVIVPLGIITVKDSNYETDDHSP